MLDKEWLLSRCAALVFFMGTLTTPMWAASIQPDDPRIQYTGRIEITAKGSMLYHSGASAKARFTGSFISATFSDQQNNSANSVGYKIDGGDWNIVQLQDGGSNQTITFATGLSQGEHTILFMRESDVSAATLTFHGFTLDNGASLLEPEPRPALRMEVYGNSVTSGGYGAPGNIWSSYWAYHNRLGRRIHAEVQSVAAGGLGLNSRYSLFESDNNSATGLDKFYTYLQPNKWWGASTQWDFSRFIPDIILFAIGANDHNRGVENSNPTGWPQDYANLVEAIVARYPQKPVLVFTQAYGAYEQLDGMIAKTAEILKNRGYDAFAYNHDLHPTQGTANEHNYHPSALGHEILAENLYDFFIQNEIVDLVGKGSTDVAHNKATTYTQLAPMSNVHSRATCFSINGRLMGNWVSTRLMQGSSPGHATNVVIIGNPNTHKKATTLMLLR